MSNKEEFVHLLRIARGLFKKQKEIEDTFSVADSEYLSYEISDLVDIVLDVINVPKDTSLSYHVRNPEYYCRDYEYSLVYEYIFGSINNPNVIYRQLKGE